MKGTSTCSDGLLSGREKGMNDIEPAVTALEPEWKIIQDKMPIAALQLIVHVYMPPPFSDAIDLGDHITQVCVFASGHLSRP